MMNRNHRRSRLAACVHRWPLACALALPLAACDTDELLEVDEPTFATPESLRNPQGLPILFAGALGDFQIAYSGSGGDSFLTVTSLLGDELHTSDTFTTRQATERRGCGGHR
jgi:hypothetical protein